MKYLRYFLILCLAMMTYSQAFASDDDGEAKKDHTPTYHIYADIYMRSIAKHKYGKQMVMKYVYPQLTSETEDEYIDRFNNRIMDMLQQFTTDFKAQITSNKSLKLPPSLAKASNTLQVDYDSSTIESGDNYIVSVRFIVNSMIVGNAHPSHYYQIYNYNLDTGDEIQLSDLFKPDADYLSVLSSYSRSVLEKQLSDKRMIDDGTEPKPENFKNWNIQANGILITFNEYQVAPYVDGAQSVLIPYSILKPLLADNAVINGCIQYHRSCVSKKLLTGGFIDQAMAQAEQVYAMSNDEPHDFGETAQKFMGFPLSLIHRT